MADLPAVSGALIANEDVFRWHCIPWATPPVFISLHQGPPSPTKQQVVTECNVTALRTILLPDRRNETRIKEESKGE